MQPLAYITNEGQSFWIIDPSHTTIEFSIRNLFVFTVKGTVAAGEGTIVLDAGTVSGSSVTAVLQPSSINTGNQRRDEHLRSPAYLDANRFPEIRFQSTRVEPGIDRDTLRVTGTLTIKNQSKEIVLDVSEIDRSRSPGGEYIAYYGARTGLDRHDFQVGGMPLLIGRRVEIAINVQATKRM